MSKNDMVMVTRELLERYVSSVEGHGYRFDGDTEIRALLDHPAEQHQGEPVALPARLPMRSPEDRNLPRGHAGGWNACLDEIANLGTLYSWPVQGEPVAFVRFRNGEPDYDGDACMIMNVPGDTLGDGDSWEAVYTHPDTRVAGYALTIRELNKEHADEVCDLRAQLGEAHALLREVHGGMWPSNPLTIKIGSHLSASAEPSAPVEVDERTEFEAHIEETESQWDLMLVRVDAEHKIHGHPHDIGEYAAPETRAAWRAWQARAALERKP